MDIVFTDLDGTLLDQGSYSFAPAEPALRLLAESDIPLVFCTSKTRAETEVWRQRLSNAHPFIVENGGAIFIPRDYFAFPAPGMAREGYAVVEFGDRYPEVVAALRDAATESGCRTEGFHDLSAEQVSRICGLSLDDARRAKLREYDEPFRLLEENPASLARLIAAIKARGKQWTRGGRFHHITGAQDKEEAAGALISLFRQAHGVVRVLGLGDGLNDAGLLNVVDFPFVVHSGQALELAVQAPRAHVTRASGPAGWNEAILGFFATYSQR